jgi:hypothetical protein
MKITMKLKFVILISLLTATTISAQNNRSKVGIRPWPRDSAHEMTGGGKVAHWKPGIGNYDAMLKADDYTAMHMDVVKGYEGVFQTRQRFFEHYIHQQGGAWVDINPETNRLIRTIRQHEEAGTVVKHIIICREGWLYDPVNGDTGPIAGDPRILFQRDVDDQRKVFRDAHAIGLIKHDNYKLIQMILHPAVFLDDPEAKAIISTMDGICYESHQFNRYWPLGSAISNPDEVARGAKWVLEQGMDYIFYYGPYQYKDCKTYYDFLERDWLKSFWEKGLPKHHKNMYYYLNAFPHSCGSSRPVGPESDPYSYLGFAKWLIQELEHGK